MMMEPCREMGESADTKYGQTSFGSAGGVSASRTLSRSREGAALYGQRPLTFSYLALIIVHIALPPCYALTLRLPLKQAVGVEMSENGQQPVRPQRSARVATQQIQGISGEGYYLDINVGTPPQKMQVLVDTGSSNFALAASADPHISHYFIGANSSTFEDDLGSIYVPYTQGEWEGELGTEVVSLDSLPNVSVHADIAFIMKSTGFFIPEANWQGIVGFAYQSIARPDTLEPFWDTLRKAAELEDIFSMQLCGSSLSHNASVEPAMVGNLVLGGVADDLYKGNIFYTPIVLEMYYEVVISDIAIDGVSLAMDCKEYNFDKTIVDSGTTHLRLPTRVFDAVVDSIQLSLKDSGVEHMPDPLFWTGDAWLCWVDPSEAFAVFPNVSLSLVSSTAHNKYFTLHLTAQHYLRSVDNQLDSLPETCLKFGISPSSTGAVLGALLMESFFVIFDREKQRMGFAETTCLPPYPPSQQPSMQVIDGLFLSQDNLTACQYQRAVTDDSSLLIVTYIMAAVCVVCTLPLIILLIQWRIRRAADKRRQLHDSEAETVLTDSR